MYKYALTMDKNGNKCIRITPKGARGFSIQTNGNLYYTHREAVGRKNGKFIPDALQVNEILHYVAEFGTKAQKAIMPLPIEPACSLYWKTRCDRLRSERDTYKRALEAIAQHRGELWEDYMERYVDIQATAIYALKEGGQND